MHVSRDAATTFGLIALLFWSTTVAFARSLSDALGTVNAAAAIFVLSGVVGCAWLLIAGHWRALVVLPCSYLFGCGALFVAYMIALYMAVGLAATRGEVIVVGIVNYLWPGMTLLLSVPILGHRARWTIWPGTLAGFGGAALAIAGAGGLSWEGFLESAGSRSLPHFLALAAAISWALYSNLTRKWASDVASHTVPLFLLASGAAFVLMRPQFVEEIRLSARAGWELTYMALIPTLLAYSLWDIAMRRGNMILVAALSYATPVLSTVFTCLYLDVSPRWSLWLGCTLVTAGAWVCKMSVTEQPENPGDRDAPRS